MKKHIKVFVIIVLMIIACVIFLEYKIHTNKNFHYGKDQGYFVRIGLILTLSTLYFYVLAKKFIFLFIGLFFGLISCLISYSISLLLARLFDLYLFGMLFHFLATILYLLSFFIFFKKFNNLI